MMCVTNICSIQYTPILMNMIIVYPASSIHENLLLSTWQKNRPLHWITLLSIPSVPIFQWAKTFRFTANCFLFFLTLVSLSGLVCKMHPLKTNILRQLCKNDIWKQLTHIDQYVWSNMKRTWISNRYFIIYLIDIFRISNRNICLNMFYVFVYVLCICLNMFYVEESMNI